MTRYVIEGARVFDGEQPIGVRTVEVEGTRIVAVGAAAPATAERVDGNGATLLPGLIDAHTHADVETLGQALRFGVTTEFDLFSFPHTMHPVRRAAAERTDIADVRSSSVGLTAPGGHPTQLHGGLNDPELPTVTRPEDAARFVDERIAEGADYIKVLIESGKTLGKTVPVVEERIVKAAVAAAHDRDRMVIAHALTLDATWQALAAGVDGFAHLFIDGPATPELIEAFRAGGAFLTPTLNLLASLTGRHLGAVLAGDSRVTGRLPQPWTDNLSREFNTLPVEQFRRRTGRGEGDARGGCTDPGRVGCQPPLRRPGHGTRGELARRTAAARAGRAHSDRGAAGRHQRARDHIRPARPRPDHPGRARRSAAGRRRSHQQDQRHPVDQGRVAQRHPGSSMRSPVPGLLTSGVRPQRSTATRSAMPGGSDRANRRAAGSSPARRSCRSAARAPRPQQ